MESNYPSNSHKSRENEEKKIEKIVSGEVKLKKKSNLVLFANRLGLVPEDIEDVKDYILREQIVPTIKNLFFDMLQTLIFGSTDYRGSRRGGGSRTSYDRYYYDRGYNNQKDSRGKARSINYDEIVFPTRGDADYVLDNLKDIIHQYGTVSIADIYDMAGITNFSHTLNQYGWDDERDVINARIVRTSDGYIIKLPKPIVIK